jgi:hypothetical protein
MADLLRLSTELDREKGVRGPRYLRRTLGLSTSGRQFWDAARPRQG